MSCPTITELVFARETASLQIAEEAAPLKEMHWQEVGHYRDIAIDPDFDRYLTFQSHGILRLYTARSAGELVGYGIFLLSTALNYKTVVTAQQSTLFLHPEHRRGMAGRSFIRWCEAQLRAESVTILTQHVKAVHDAARNGAFVRLLKRDGYELQDYVLTKRL